MSLPRSAAQASRTSTHASAGNGGRAEPFGTTERLWWAALVASMLGLVAIVLYGEPWIAERLTSEDGVFEQLSWIGWLALAATVLASAGLNRHGVSLSLVAIVFSARELDLHKVVAQDSLFKINFYTGQTVALHDKLLGGTIALLVLATLAWGLWLNGRAYWRQALWRRSGGRIVAVALLLLVVAKVFDRTPAILKDEWHRPLSWTASHLVTVHEEWFECVVPWSLVAAAWALRRRPVRAAQIGDAAVPSRSADAADAAESAAPAGRGAVSR